jgi:1-acyl-sn-glycerol-3-phosphate acyltransferase
MTKSDEDLERPRRPAARRAGAAPSEPPPPVSASASDTADGANAEGQRAAPAAKRIHARRPANDADANAPTTAKIRRPAAVRAARAAAAQPEPSTRAQAVVPPPAASPAFARGDLPAGSPQAAEPETTRVAHARLHSDAAAPESSTWMLTTTATAKTPSRRTSTALRMRSELTDEFGLDVAYEAKLRPFFEAMSRNYLHVQVIGAQHIPARGRALLVSNHSRSLAWDGILLRTALRLHHQAQREVRWLVEDDQFHAPFLGTFVNRLGAVRACQENAERLLQREELVAVFPEGAKGSDKRYQDRHKLHRFGRGGYVKLALRTGAPVIPVAIVGNDDPPPMLSRVKLLSRWVGGPLFALTSGLPRLGPLGVPPVPGRWRIAIGEPIQEIARQDVDAVRDEGIVHELNECVRSAIKQLVEQALPDVS